ncbi:hypothetical protein K0M31_016691 [Melipona bicolor]|uniref:Uncharacterized protein n=1 Tax=Melipona bicolor TaxID=60889 RepID=A0AA40FE24_9HYME|nr:hypothetical protein K0M31_016691 [Melipona bicolor]
MRSRKFPAKNQVKTKVSSKCSTNHVKNVDIENVPLISLLIDHRFKPLLKQSPSVPKLLVEANETNEQPRQDANCKGRDLVGAKPRKDDVREQYDERSGKSFRLFRFLAFVGVAYEEAYFAAVQVWRVSVSFLRTER